MKISLARAALSASIAFSAFAVGHAHASLIKGDFLSAGDGLLVTDTVSGIQWLTPLYTKSHLYNDAFVQSVNSAYGFRYATGTEALNLINANFGTPPSASPGTAAGFSDASAFFSYFGIAANFICGSPCPRTQGLTSTVNISGTHAAFGMIQVGSNGWAIENNNWGDTFSDTQMGSWLVRTRANPDARLPEPASLALTGAGLLGLCAVLGRRGRTRSGMQHRPVPTYSTM